MPWYFFFHILLRLFSKTKYFPSSAKSYIVLWVHLVHLANNKIVPTNELFRRFIAWIRKNLIKHNNQNDTTNNKSHCLQIIMGIFAVCTKKQVFSYVLVFLHWNAIVWVFVTFKNIAPAVLFPAYFCCVSKTAKE